MSVSPALLKEDNNSSSDPSKVYSSYGYGSTVRQLEPNENWLSVQGSKSSIQSSIVTVKPVLRKKSSLGYRKNRLQKLKEKSELLNKSEGETKHINVSIPKASSRNDSFDEVTPVQS